MRRQRSWSFFVHRAVALLVLLALWPPLVGSSTADRAMPAYAERTWGMQDGLPEQVVQAFAQTHDRYLWIGTDNGLFRISGDRVERAAGGSRHSRR